MSVLHYLDYKGFIRPWCTFQGEVVKVHIAVDISSYTGKKHVFFMNAYGEWIKKFSETYEVAQLVFFDLFIVTR